MEILLIFFIAFIFLSAISSENKQPRRVARRSTHNNFRTYFNSLPEDTQTNYFNTMNDIQRIQFMALLNDNNTQINESIINEFNEWSKQECNCDTAPFEQCCQEDSINYEDCSCDEIKWRESCNSEDTSSWEYTQSEFDTSNDSWESDNSFSSNDNFSSDSSSFSDSGSFDSGTDTGSSNF
jgi:hypothetical protein